MPLPGVHLQLGPAVDAEALEDKDEVPELFGRLKALAKQAVPEIETKDWARGFNRKIQPEHIPFFLMRVQGYKVREIAEMNRVSVETVRRVLKSPAGQELLRELYSEAGMAPAEVTGAFQDAAMDAVDIVIDMAHNAEKDEVRLKAAFSILDRAGYGITQKKEVSTKLTVATVSNAELSEMRAALQESLETPAEFEVLASRPLEEIDASDTAA